MTQIVRREERRELAQSVVIHRNWQRSGWRGGDFRGGDWRGGGRGGGRHWREGASVCVCVCMCMCVCVRGAYGTVALGVALRDDDDATIDDAATPTLRTAPDNTRRHAGHHATPPTAHHTCIYQRVGRLSM